MMRGRCRKRIENDISKEEKIVIKKKRLLLFYKLSDR